MPPRLSRSAKNASIFPAGAYASISLPGVLPTHAESPGDQELSLPISDDVAGSRPPRGIHLEPRRTTRLRYGADGEGAASFLVTMLHYEQPAVTLLCGHFEGGRTCGNWTNFPKSVLARMDRNSARRCFSLGSLPKDGERKSRKPESEKEATFHFRH